MNLAHLRFPEPVADEGGCREAEPVKPGTGGRGTAGMGGDPRGEGLRGGSLQGPQGEP